MPITMQRTLLLIGCLLSAVSLALAADNAAISAQHPMSGEELTGLLENSLRNLWKVQDGTLTVEFERNLPDFPTSRRTVFAVDDTNPATESSHLPPI